MSITDEKVNSSVVKAGVVILVDDKEDDISMSSRTVVAASTVETGPPRVQMALNRKTKRCILSIILGMVMIVIVVLTVPRGVVFPRQICCSGWTNGHKCRLGCVCSLVLYDAHRV